MKIFSQVAGYVTSPRYPAHMVLQAASTLDDFRRLKKIMDRFCPDSYLVITDPEEKIERAKKLAKRYETETGRQHAPVVESGIFNYAIRIWYNPELEKFTIYRKLKTKALLYKLMK